VKSDEVDRLKKQLQKLRGENHALKPLAALLVEVFKKKYHYPDSDFMEYCAGCGRSPYYVPPHTEGCLVVRIVNALREAKMLPNDSPWIRD
jgi:hypothetical protein